MHCIVDKYLEIKEDSSETPITAIFGAKVLQHMWSQRISFILCLQEIINNDPEVSPYLKAVVMVENYNVTKAEKLIPACDIRADSASKEASGTGIIEVYVKRCNHSRYRDVNVEIHELVGDDNIFVFGASSDEVIEHYKSGLFTKYYKKNQIKAVLISLQEKQMMKIRCKESGGSAKELIEYYNM